MSPVLPLRHIHPLRRKTRHTKGLTMSTLNKYYDDWVAIEFLTISRKALKIGPGFLANSYIKAAAKIALCNFLTPLAETFSSN